jgi:hypothetical protein
VTYQSPELSEQCRLALLAPEGRGVLAIRNGPTVRLPRIHIARFARSAQQITVAVRELFQLDSIVLEFLQEASTEPRCAVAEILSDIGDLSHQGLSLVDISLIHGTDLSDGECKALLAIAEGNGGNRAPLSRVGWLAEARSWIRANAGSRPCNFTGRLTQFNGGGNFCLLRLETSSGPALWLKAVGEPNLHEYDTTMYLADVQPRYLPPILCSRSDWHAWVMEEVGADLEGTAHFAACARAVEALARLQIAMLGKAEHLISCGSAEHRAPALLVHLEDVFAFVAEAMALQRGGIAPPLARTRVMELKEIVRLALATIEKIGIPHSIAHNDMSLSNVLCDDARCVFIDWCEAYLGNPFNAFELFRVVLNRHVPSSLDWTDELRSIYAAHWIDILGETEVKVLLTLTPVLTIYSSLYSRGRQWIEAHRNDSLFQRRTRILARHLERASCNPEFLRLVYR